jgi:hypothetical protein
MGLRKRFWLAFAGVPRGRLGFVDIPASLIGTPQFQLVVGSKPTRGAW